MMAAVVGGNLNPRPNISTPEANGEVGVVGSGAGHKGAATGRVCAGLKELRETIRDCRALQETAQALRLQVLSVRRYITDRSLSQDPRLACVAATSRDNSVFDVVVTDGASRLKCLLAPSSNSLVNQHRLAVGSIVEVKPHDCLLFFNESNLEANGIVILQQVTIVGRETISPGAAISVYVDGDEGAAGEHIPLMTTRGCYVSLWNNEDQEGPCWDHRGPELVTSLQAGNLVHIADIAASWQRRERPYPDLLVRVTHRARVKLYAKRDKQERWPYQLHLEVMDGSGVVTVVLWNSLVCQYFHSVPDGTLLIIQGYSIRQRFQLLSKPANRGYPQPTFDLEFALNKNQSEISVLDPNVRLPPRFSVPELRSAFYSRAQICCLPNDFNIDVAGIVVYVGRYQRERKDAVDGFSFWMYRWIGLADETSVDRPRQPIRMQVYAGSQPEEQRKLRPGSLIVATQMKVVVDDATLMNSRQKRHVHVTTTFDSQIFVEGGGYRSHDRVQRVRDWFATPEGQQFVQSEASVGGYYCYPPLPADLGAYKESLRPDEPLKPTPGESIKADILSLCYREQQRFHCLGFVVAVEFLPLRQVAPAGGATSSASAPELGTRGEGSNGAAGACVSHYNLRSRSFLLRLTQSQSAVPVVDGDRRVGEDPKGKRLVGKGTKRKQLLAADAVIADAGPAGAAFDPSVTVDRLWSRLSECVPLLGARRPHPSFLRRRFHPNTDDELFDDELLMSTSTTGPHAAPGLAQLEPTDCSCNACFIVTILGVNESIALNALLPLCISYTDPTPSPHSATPHPPTAAHPLARELSFLDLLGAQSSIKLPVGTRNSGQPSMAMNDATQSLNISETIATCVGRLLEESKALAGQRILFVLDAYGVGEVSGVGGVGGERGEGVEVVLNRGYLIANS